MRCSPEKVPEHIRLFTIARWKACNISFRNHYQAASYVLVSLLRRAYCRFDLSIKGKKREKGSDPATRSKDPQPDPLPLPDPPNQAAVSFIKLCRDGGGVGVEKVHLRPLHDRSRCASVPMCQISQSSCLPCLRPTPAIEYAKYRGQEEEDECGICFDSLPASELVQPCLECQLTYCKNCVASHLQEVVMNGPLAIIPAVRCPGSTCRGRLRQEIWRPLCPPEVATHHQRRCQNSLSISCAQCHNLTSFFLTGNSQQAALEWRSTLDSDEARTSFESQLDAYTRGLLSEGGFLDQALLTRFGLVRSSVPDIYAPHLELLSLAIADEALRARFQLHCLKLHPRVTTHCCARHHCFACQSIWHNQMTCAEYKAAVVPLHEDVVACPGCGASLTKGDGCDMIRCYCGMSFQWSLVIRKSRRAMAQVLLDASTGDSFAAGSIAVQDLLLAPPGSEKFLRATAFKQEFPCETRWAEALVWESITWPFEAEASIASLRTFPQGAFSLAARHRVLARSWAKTHVERIRRTEAKQQESRAMAWEAMHGPRSARAALHKLKKPASTWMDRGEEPNTIIAHLEEVIAAGRTSGVSVFGDTGYELFLAAAAHAYAHNNPEKMKKESYLLDLEHARAWDYLYERTAASTALAIISDERRMQGLQEVRRCLLLGFVRSQRARLDHERCARFLCHHGFSCAAAAQDAVTFEEKASLGHAPPGGGLVLDRVAWVTANPALVHNEWARRQKIRVAAFRRRYPTAKDARSAAKRLSAGQSTRGNGLLGCCLPNRCTNQEEAASDDDILDAQAWLRAKNVPGCTVPVQAEAGASSRDLRRPGRSWLPCLGPSAPPPP